jgi:ParB/RepB/Spo0J family partition protein
MLHTKRKPQTGAVGQLDPDMRSEYRKANEKQLSKINRMMNGVTDDDDEPTVSPRTKPRAVKSPGTVPGKFTQLIDDAKPIIEEIPIRYLAPSPYQPRKTFDEAAMQELAASLGEEGTNRTLLIVRLTGDMTYEIIAGERRWRAAKMAGLTVLRCEVRTLTDEEARKLCRQENLERQDLTAIERVTTYRDMLRDGDFATQSALADALGITPAALSNQLRVLELPEYFLGLVSQEKIGLTHLRCLVPWISVSSVLTRLRSELESDEVNFLEDWSIHDPEQRLPTVKEFEELVADCVKHVSRPIEGKHVYENHWGFDGERLTITTDDLPLPSSVKSDNGTLQVIDCGKELGRRAFNIDVWNALSEHAKKQRAKGSRLGLRPDADNEEIGTESQSTKKKPKRSAAEQRQLDEQHAKTYQRNLYTYRIAWLQKRIAAEIRKAELHTLAWHLTAWAVGARADAIQCRGEALGEAAIAAGGKQRARNAVSTDVWKTILTVINLDPDFIADDDPTVTTLRELLAAWYSIELTSYRRPIDEEFIEHAAAQLSIDFANEWTLDREFLEIHTAAQLTALHTEWKVLGTPATKRGALIDQLLTIKAVPLPKCLAKLKPCSITC